MTLVYVSKSAAIGYEKLAQRAILLLQHAIQRDFASELAIGAELEIGYANTSHILGNLGGDAWDNKHVPLIPRYMLTNASRYTSKQSVFLDNHRYLSHFYWDEGRLEAVFAHNSPVSNGLRLAGSIENFKKHLFSDPELTGEAEITLSPYTEFKTETRIQKQYTRGLEFNFSFKKQPTQMFRTGTNFRLAFDETIMELLYFGASTIDAVTRFCRKVGFSIESGTPIYSPKFMMPRGVVELYLECDYLAPNSNAYLGMAGLLAAIYNGLERELSNQPLQDRKGIILPKIYAYDEAEKKLEMIGFLANRFDESRHFRNVLNRLSEGEELGDRIIEAVLSADKIVSPIGDEIVKVSGRQK